MGRKNNLIVIPARGGSKRLPGKNLMRLGGKTLLEHAISAAKNSGIEAEICVSTDSKRIADEAAICGAPVPFMRPESLAADDSTTIDVLIHAMDFYKDQGHNIENLIVLQPTSPLRSPEDVRKAFSEFSTKKADALVSLTKCEHPPEWSNVVADDGAINNFLSDEILNIRSQDLKQKFRVNGAIYIAKTEVIYKQRTFYLKENCYSYIMPNERSIDIDSMFDYQFAQFLMESYDFASKT